MIVFVHLCCPQKEFSLFCCDTGMTSKTTTPCALRKPWARMREPTPASLRIELEKWKPLLRSLCEVSVPMEAGPVSHTDNCFLMGWATSFPTIVWVPRTLCNGGCCTDSQRRGNPGPVDNSGKILIDFSGMGSPCGSSLVPVCFYWRADAYICINKHCITMGIDINMWAISSGY